MSDVTLRDFRSTAAAETGAAAARIDEDWLAVILGLGIFVLGLAVLVHVDLIGWVVSTAVWSHLGQALGPVSKNYGPLGGIGALLGEDRCCRRWPVAKFRGKNAR